MPWTLFTNTLICAILTIGLGNAPTPAPAREPTEDWQIDLAGQWQVKLDPTDVGIQAKWQSGFTGTPIKLPGICTEAGLGSQLNLPIKLDKRTLKHLHQHHRYLGAAWYSRQFALPANWQAPVTYLVLERVMWQSQVWINGQFVGSAESLSTPHHFRVDAHLRPGINDIAIRVDNRDLAKIGQLGHGYTDETQTIWNGILGELKLEGRPLIAINSVRVGPTFKGQSTVVRLDASNFREQPVKKNIKIELIASPQSEPIVSFEKAIDIRPGHSTVQFPLNINADLLSKWSEHSPNVYRVCCHLDGRQVSSVAGFRNVESKSGRMLVNGVPSFLRGTVDCCIFPKTGYPTTQPAEWLRRFRILKSCGLNHVRFHSWCPPEAAFAAADQLGIYLQVELPNWRNNVGEIESAEDYLIREGIRILETYSHHPSFTLFSLGNELKGDVEELDRQVRELRKRSPELLFASTSFSFSPRGNTPGPEDDFFVTQQTTKGWVRAQRSFEQTRPNTQADFEAQLRHLEVPIISHEIGQYAAFPNLAEIEKFTGNLRPLAFEAIRNDLASKGRSKFAEPYATSSAALGRLLYKEEVERALRTPSLDGFQLLALQDFPGQSTATVGLLDAFYQEKPGATLNDIRAFCNDVVPLLRLPKRCWRSSDTLSGTLEIRNDGPNDLEAARVSVGIYEGDTQIFNQTFVTQAARGQLVTIGKLNVPLNQFNKPTRLKIIAELAAPRSIQNNWLVWVYPNNEPLAPSNLSIHRNLSEPVFQKLEAGERVLLLPSKETLKTPIAGQFIPVFWSPVHFPNQPGTMGTVINHEHPVFQDFPTESHTNWQWWELLENSTAFDLAPLEIQAPPIMQFIDKFNRNALPALLWETNVGKGKLFVCSMDISNDLDKRIVAGALRRSILDYMSGDDFQPTQSVTPEQLKVLLKSQTKPRALSR